MARRSRWEHLKDEIVQHCKNGLSPRELYPIYPNVPPKTIRRWHELVTPKISPEFAQDSPEIKTVAPQDIQVVNPQQKLVAIDGGEQVSDFALARKTLRAIAKNFNQPGAGVGVQAAIGLIKLVQIRAELPRHVLDEIETTGIEEERDRVKELSLEELQQQYKDAANG